MIGLEGRPRFTVAVGAVRSHPLAHLADQFVADLALAAVADGAGLLSGVDVAADRLAVHRRQPVYRPLALPAQPQPQHLPDLVHWNLPEAHRTCLGRLSVRWRLQPQRRRRWWMLRGGPITGERVVSCCWRNSRLVVPCRWRATRRPLGNGATATPGNARDAGGAPVGEPVRVSRSLAPVRGRLATSSRPSLNTTRGTHRPSWRQQAMGQRPLHPCVQPTPEGHWARFSCR